MQVRLDNDIEIMKLFNELSNHTFSAKNLVNFAKNECYNEPQEHNAVQNCVSPKKNQKKDTMFDPSLKHKDSLFWCFYVMLFGIDAYDMIGNQHFVEEKKIKFKYIEILRSKKDILKMHKIKPLSEIEDDLANKEKIGLKCFIALCIVANLNAMIINKQKYYEIIMNDNNEPIIIYQKSQPLKFTMSLESTKEIIDSYRNKYFKLETIEYKLKSINSYKMEELVELCNKLEINMNCDSTNKKITKKILYDKIILHF